MPEKAEKKIYDAIGHIHNVPHTFTELIISPEERCFFRQVFYYGLSHTGVKEFGMRCCVKETVKVDCIVQDIDVSSLSRPPFDHRQKPLGIVLQNAAVFADSL